jgi:hypothetical protein
LSGVGLSTRIYAVVIALLILVVVALYAARTVDLPVVSVTTVQTQTSLTTTTEYVTTTVTFTQSTYSTIGCGFNKSVLSTNWLTPSTPLQTNSFGESGIQESYTDVINSAISDVYVWVLVSTPAGISVGNYTSSIASISPGQTVTAFIPLTNLHSGNYTALVFATLCKQFVLSVTATLPVTVR